MTRTDAAPKLPCRVCNIPHAYHRTRGWLGADGHPYHPYHPYEPAETSDATDGYTPVFFGTFVECAACGCIAMNLRRSIARHTRWHHHNDTGDAA